MLPTPSDGPGWNPPGRHPYRKSAPAREPIVLRSQALLRFRIRLETRLEPVHIVFGAFHDLKRDGFRHFIAVSLLQNRADGIEKRAGCFDQEQAFLGSFNRALPAIEASHAGDQVAAGG